ncbi:MAG: hypothetical protein LQ346_002476 [Caloplaca aetnensis]|nr:MAG: hypothetical protein LQ346_002476 [Caloplaca aetnensis]
MAVTPPTPPPTAPTSPTATAPCDSDSIVNINRDPEKGYNEKDPDPRRSPTIGTGGTDHQLRTIPNAAMQVLTSKLTGFSVDDHPRGYPNLAAFMISSDNFLMCRGFAFLHSRVLLHRQDELAEMEKTLLAMDEEDIEFGEELALQSRRRDDLRPEQPSRKSLIDKIDTKLKDYDDLTMRIRTMVAIPKPSERDYSSFYRWIDAKKPLCREETKFVKHQDDFIALAEKQEGGWFDGVLEDLLSIFPRRLTRAILSSPSDRKKTDDEYVQLYSKYRVDTLVRLVLTIVTVVLLMAPTAILFLVPEHAVVKLVVIVVFTLLFSAALGVFTKAKRHEMFAATAA